jgi:ATP-dependent Lhr-like helicase
LVLSAIDPANPHGALLPWPAPRNPEARPARRAGASVIIVDGAAALYVEAKSRKLVSFADARAEDLARAVTDGLRALASQSRSRTLRIERIDGEPASRSPLAPALEQAGFRAEYRGLMLEVAG